MEKPSSLPPSYVTLKQLQELRLMEKQRQEEEEESRREEEGKLEEVKAEEEEERVRASRGKPSKPRKPSYRNRRGNGSRLRNAAPKEEDAEVEVEQVAKRDAMGATSEISKPGEDDGKGAGAVGVGGDVIDGKDSNKMKYSRSKKKKGESGTGGHRSNRGGPRGKVEYRPLLAPGGELARPPEISRHFVEEVAEISQHFGVEAENVPEKIEPSRNQIGGKGENQQSGSTPERSMVTACQVEHQRCIGDDGERETERRRPMRPRGGGRFSRGGKTVTGAGQGLVWVRKGSVS